MQVKFDIKCDRLRPPDRPSPVVQVPSLSRATFMSQACAAVSLSPHQPPPRQSAADRTWERHRTVGAARLGKPESRVSVATLTAPFRSLLAQLDSHLHYSQSGT